LIARDSTDILENRKISFSCQDLNPESLRLLAGKPAEGNGLLGSPTYREKENIKVDLKRNTMVRCRLYVSGSG
jgi:hypothetical protein